MLEATFPEHFGVPKCSGLKSIPHFWWNQTIQIYCNFEAFPFLPMPEVWVGNTLDERNPKQPPGMYKTYKNNGINYLPQLVKAGFLNHQQYNFDPPENFAHVESFSSPASSEPNEVADAIGRMGNLEAEKGCMQMGKLQYPP